MDNNSKIQVNKLEYQAPYFEAVEFEYSDVIQVSACLDDICAQESTADFWSYFETQ